MSKAKTVNCKKCGAEIIDHKKLFGEGRHDECYCEGCFVKNAELALREKANELVNFIEIKLGYLRGYVSCYRNVSPQSNVGKYYDDIDFGLNISASENNYSFCFEASGWLINAKSERLEIDIQPCRYDMNINYCVDLYPNNMRYYARESALYKSLVVRFNEAIYQRFDRKRIDWSFMPSVCKRCNNLERLINKNSYCDNCLAEIKKESDRHEEVKRLASQEAEKEAQRLANREAGYIYLLVAPTGQSKIGFTRNLKNRLTQFRNVFPGIDFHHVVKTDDMRYTEKQLHKRFSDKSVGGEWFSLDDADIDYFKSLKESA